LLGTLPTSSGFPPVQSLEELWNECVQAIYGGSRAPQAARQWFLIGAACLLDVFDRMAEDLQDGTSDETTTERLNRLRHHLRLACRCAADPNGSSCDWGPH
jgi:hypothetical protein